MLNDNHLCEVSRRNFIAYEKLIKMSCGDKSFLVCIIVEKRDMIQKIDN